MIDYYLKSLAAASSREAQASALKSVERILGKPLMEATVDELAALRASLIGQYSPATARRYLTAARGVYRMAWRHGAINHEQHARIADTLTLRNIPVPRSSRGILTAGQIRALVGELDKSSPTGRRNAAAIALLYGAGLRSAEACQLEREYFVPGALRVVKGKRGQTRIVPIPPGVTHTLTQWCDMCDAQGIAEGPILRGVSRGIIGRGLSRSGLRKLVQRIAAAVGIDASPHDFRRAYISHLLDTRATLSVAAALAGHASTTTTARYDLRGFRAQVEAVNTWAATNPLGIEEE